MANEHRDRLYEINKEIKEKQSEMVMWKHRAVPINQNINRLDRELKNLYKEQKIEDAAAEVMVTEHSIMRYLERIEGVDIEEYKDKVLPKEYRHKLLYKEGDNDVGTHLVRIKNGVVMTVIPKNNGNKIINWVKTNIVEKGRTVLADLLDDKTKERLKKMIEK